MKEDDATTRDSVARAFLELVGIVHRLRAPGGCPWDRQQTPESLKPFVIEEAYEVIDAIDGGDQAEICEELGDLLLQIVLQAEIAREDEHFGIERVIRGISRKLVERHPHVFGDVAVETAGEVLVNWEKIKKKEKVGRGLFDGLPSHLPALQRAARMGEKAARVGFDWTDLCGVREKVSEELDELDEAIADKDTEAVQHELGDLLFSIAQWARHLGLHPEEALRSASTRFRERFSKVEDSISEQGKTIENADLEELEALWQQAKDRR